ncbi:MAG: hypothetical protein ABIK52_09790 [Bacteroidota bacterium]
MGGDKFGGIHHHQRTGMLWLTQLDHLNFKDIDIIFSKSILQIVYGGYLPSAALRTLLDLLKGFVKTEPTFVFEYYVVDFHSHSNNY